MHQLDDKARSITANTVTIVKKYLESCKLSHDSYGVSEKISDSRDGKVIEISIEVLINEG